MSNPSFKIGKYTIDKKNLVGKGQYGLVFQATYDNEVYCVKILQRNGNEEKFVKREEEILKQLINQPIQNPNLVYTYEVKEDQQKNEIYIIMEYCRGGDLKQEMLKKRKSNQWYSSQESVNIIAQIIRGYKTLHSLNFFHRDIKPANILISSGFYKLADFGMGRFIDPGNLTVVGTPAYTAPEIFFGRQYSNKCDIYSLGVMLYELIYKEVPVNGKTSQELIQKLRKTEDNEIKCPQNDNLDIRIKVLIEQMLRFDERNRIGWNELFNHQLFSGQGINQHSHMRRSSLLVPQQQAPFQKRPSTPYYHFSNKSFDTLKDAMSFDGLRHIAEVLMSKGDVAYDLACTLSEQHEIQEDQLNAILFCLISYKYFICINTMGICTNQQQYCHQSIVKIFPNFSDLIIQYSSSDQQDIQLMKQIINSSLGYLSGYYRDLQQNVLSQKGLKEQHQLFYNSVDEHDQTDFTSFLIWFSQFYNTWFQGRIFPNSNQFNKILSLETAFPLEKFWEKSPSQIIRIRTNSL